MVRDDLIAMKSMLGSWEAVVADIEALLPAAVDDAERIGLLVDVATVKMDELGDPAGARPYLELAADLDISTPACDRLAQIYRELGLWDELVALQHDRSESATDEAARRALIGECAAVYSQHLGKPDEAWKLHEQMLRQAPADADIRAAAREFARAGTLLPEFAALLAEQVAALSEKGEDDDALKVQRELVSIYLGPLARVEMAELWLDRILEHHPYDPDSLHDLVTLREKQGDNAALAEALERVVKAGGRDVEEPTLRLVALYATELNSPARAAEVLAHHVAEPPDVALLAKLQSYQLAADRNDDAVATLEKRIDLSEAAERPMLLRELATIHRDQRRDAGKAAEALESSLELSGDDDAGLADLEALYASASRESDVRRVRDRRIRLAEDPAARAALLRQQAVALEAVSAEDAVAAWEAVLHIDAADPAAREALLRLYAANGRHDALVARLEDEAARTDDKARACELLGRAGELLANELNNPGEALRVLRAAHEARPDDAAVLERVISAATVVGDSATAASALTQLATLQPERGAEHLVAAARLRAQFDSEGIEGAWVAVLARDPLSDAAHEALRDWYSAHDRANDLVALHRRRAEAERDISRRSAQLVEAATVLVEKLADTEGARGLWEDALELDPNNIYAAAPLADIYIGEAKWERVRTLLRLILADARYDASAAAQATLRYNLGVACDALGLLEEAAEAWRAALALEPQHVEAMRGLALLLAQSRKDDEAAALFDALFAGPIDGIPDDERVAICFEAGEVERRRGNGEKARGLYERALEYDAWHEPSLRALALTTDAAQSPLAVIEARTKLLTITEEPAARVKLLIDIAEAYAATGDRERAVETLRVAAETDPASKVVLHKHLELANRFGDWHDAARVLGKLTDLESDPARKLKFAFAVAAMFRDQLGDIARARKAFDAILDVDPLQDEAFDAITAMLEQSEDYVGLGQHLRRQLERLLPTGERDRKISVLRKIVEFADGVMNNAGEALAGCRMILELDPNDVDTLERVIRIYPPEGKTDDDVVRQHLALLRAKPDAVDSWHTLFAVFRRRREFDRAWLFSSALQVIGSAEPRERDFYADYRPEGLSSARKALGNDEWRLLAADDLDLVLTRLFTLLGQHATGFARDLRDLGIDKRRQRLEMDANNPVAALFAYAAGALNLPVPEIYVAPQARGILNANAYPHALIIGADVMQAPVNRSLVFRIARAMTLMRPEFYMASAWNSNEALKTFVYGTVALFTGKVVPDPSVEAVSACANELRRLPEPALAQLGACIQGFIESGEGLDVGRWLRAVERISTRSGLLLCGDLARAIEGLRAEPVVLGQADEGWRISDLVRFALTDEYADLRARLGLALGM
jgi:tetratricopeptide (TPR) repeat protein